MLTFTEENYLKMILTLSQREGKVLVKSLSRELGVKMPTVNSMMKKLSEKGYIYFDSYKPILLTEVGQQAATLVLRKHRLTEMFLYEKMGLGWEQVHKIAEQIEHIKSDLFFDKMDEMLNYPKTDPHGEPIPTKEGDFFQSDDLQLSSFDKGDVVLFMAVGDSSNEFLEYLNKRELHIGQKIKIISKETFDNSLIISCNNRKEVVLSKMVCDKILVTKS